MRTGCRRNNWSRNFSCDWSAFEVKQPNKRGPCVANAETQQTHHQHAAGRTIDKKKHKAICKSSALYIGNCSFTVPQTPCDGQASSCLTDLVHHSIMTCIRDTAQHSSGNLTTPTSHCEQPPPNAPAMPAVGFLGITWCSSQTCSTAHQLQPNPCQQPSPASVSRTVNRTVYRTVHNTLKVCCTALPKRNMPHFPLG